MRPKLRKANDERSRTTNHLKNITAIVCYFVMARKEWEILTCDMNCLGPVQTAKESISQLTGRRLSIRHFNELQARLCYSDNFCSLVWWLQLLETFQTSFSTPFVAIMAYQVTRTFGIVSILILLILSIGFAFCMISFNRANSSM